MRLIKFGVALIIAPILALLYILVAISFLLLPIAVLIAPDVLKFEWEGK